MYEMGQTMEEVNEGWIDNKNRPKVLNSKEKILKVQLYEIVVVMCMH
jgi:hypothetical protein